MTITPFQIYLITRCNAMKAFLIGGGFSSAVIFALGLVWWILSCETDQEEEEKHRAESMTKTSLPLLAVFVLLATLTPTTKEAIAMISIPAIANSQLVQQDIPEAVHRLWRQYAEREDRKEEERK